MLQVLPARGAQRSAGSERFQPPKGSVSGSKAGVVALAVGRKAPERPPSSAEPPDTLWFQAPEVRGSRGRLLQGDPAGPLLPGRLHWARKRLHGVRARGGHAARPEGLCEGPAPEPPQPEGQAVPGVQPAGKGCAPCPRPRAGWAAFRRCWACALPACLPLASRRQFVATLPALAVAPALGPAGLGCPLTCTCPTAAGSQPAWLPAGAAGGGRAGGRACLKGGGDRPGGRRPEACPGLLGAALGVPFGGRG